MNFEKKIIKILIADDHQMFIDGIAASLKDNEFINIISTANNGAQAIRQLEKELVDVVLLDINMPEMNGIEAAKIIVKNHPLVRIIALSMYLEKEFIEELIHIGVSGYILKNTTMGELEQAIISVSSGKKYFSNDVALKMLDAQTNNEYAGKIDSEPTSQVGLTEREVEVLKLITKEFTTPEIAKKLFISVYTVETHRKNLIRKLNVKNIAGLVKYAIQNGITD
jgi:DNA-binding NarL/FixJ family response regulator